MKPRDIVTYYRTQMAAASAIKVSKQAVSLWVRLGEIPIGRQIQFETASGGALRADLPDAVRYPRPEKAVRA